MKVVIWHNPKCSKSRQAMTLLEEKGITPEVRQYLKDPPSRQELGEALKALDRPAMDMVRKREAEFAQAGLTQDSTKSAVLDALAAYPRLIERPVVFAGGKARIGRPTEAILEIL